MARLLVWLRNTQTGDRADLNLGAPNFDRLVAHVVREHGPAWPDAVPLRAATRLLPVNARREAEPRTWWSSTTRCCWPTSISEVTVFPPYDHMIIDEAHNLEEVATDQFGFEVDQAELLKFLDDLFMTGGGQHQRRPVRRAAQALPRERRRRGRHGKGQRDLRRRPAGGHARPPERVRLLQSADRVHERTRPRSTAYDARLRLTDAVRKNAGWAAVERAWENLSINLDAIGDALGKLEVLLTDLKDAELLEYDMLLLRVQSLKRYATKVRINIGYIVARRRASS